jgi:hypothetical protein
MQKQKILPLLKQILMEQIFFFGRVDLDTVCSVYA